MSLSAEQVRVYLGAFPLSDDCALPLCRRVAFESHAWIIGGQLLVLPLCSGCVTIGRAELSAKPKRARVVSL